MCNFNMQTFERIRQLAGCSEDQIRVKDVRNKQLWVVVSDDLRFNQTGYKAILPSRPPNAVHGWDSSTWLVEWRMVVGRSIGGRNVVERVVGDQVPSGLTPDLDRLSDSVIDLGLV
jgi:hypothetical protein